MLILTDTVVYVLAMAVQEEPQVLWQGQGIVAGDEGHRFAVIALDNGTVVLISRGATRDIKTGVEEPITSVLILREEPLEALIGTEGAHLYRLKGDEGPATRIDSFDALEVRNEWHTPWGGPPAVRSLAGTSEGWVYADIHVGSIMRSPDGGASWAPVTPSLNEDVHQVATCPADASRVYANTANAVYISEDRGQSWTRRAEGLSARYGRAIAVHPEDPDLILATVSDGPRGENVHGKLYRSEDGGRTWQQVKDGFPESTKGNIDTHGVTFTPDGLAWAAADDTLYVGENRATEWKEAWKAPKRIRVLAAPGGK